MVKCQKGCTKIMLSIVYWYFIITALDMQECILIFYQIISTGHFNMCKYDINKSFINTRPFVLQCCDRCVHRHRSLLQENAPVQHKLFVVNKSAIKASWLTSDRCCK
jgi:hypothetical protein